MLNEVQQRIWYTFRHYQFDSIQCLFFFSIQKFPRGFLNHNECLIQQELQYRELKEKFFQAVSSSLLWPLVHLWSSKRNVWVVCNLYKCFFASWLGGSFFSPPFYLSLSTAQNHNWLQCDKSLRGALDRPPDKWEGSWDCETRQHPRKTRLLWPQQSSLFVWDT